MARPKKEIPSRSAIVPAAMRHARGHGLDVEALAWRFGLSEGIADREEASAPAGVADELMQAVAQTAGEGDVALRVAPTIETRALKLVDLVVRSSATVRGAAACLARATVLLHEGLEASLEDGSRWVLRTPRRPRGMGRHVHELVLAYTLDRLRQAAGEAFEVERAWFANPRPPRIDHLTAFFAARDLAFGCGDSGLALSPAALERAAVRADPRTVEAILPLVDAEIDARPRGVAFAERVAAHIQAALPHGTDVADVARAMHMSPRTLQRRLEQEDTRFGEVVDRARLARARTMLAHPETALLDVAFALGFADLATFSRAFKRWTGMPPGQWRRS